MSSTTSFSARPVGPRAPRPIPRALDRAPREKAYADRRLESPEDDERRRYTPEDQAYSAIDNNFDTAWITGTFVPDPAGQWWQANFANPVTTDHVTLVQPQRGDRSRWVSGVTLTFDGKDPVHEALTSASHLRRARHSPSRRRRSTRCA